MLHPRTFAFSLAAALVVQIAQPAVSATIAFTDATSTAGVGHRSESYGASWGDVNGDGYPDIFASNHRTMPSLYVNQKNGTFVDKGASVLWWKNRPTADTHGGSWADFDNDGDQDLTVSTGTGNFSQFFVNQGGQLTYQTNEHGLDIANLGGRLPVWLDYDGDKLLDFVMTQYGGIAKLYHQKADHTFVETTGTVKLLCKRFHYGQLYDVNNDDRLDFLCPAETLFPQKIYNTLPVPWQKLFDSDNPNSTFKVVKSVVDSTIADFDNNGRMDMFVLSGVQLHPSGVAQATPTSTHFESQLAGGTKGFRFVSTGKVTFKFDWNRADEGTAVDLAKVKIGKDGWHPTAIPFTLDPTKPNVVGMPPTPTSQSNLPAMHIGFDPAKNQWTLFIQTRLDDTSPPVFSEAYLQIDSTTAITNLAGTGLWSGDKEARPTLLMNFSGGISNETDAAGLGAPIQCVSATAGDFDNDMDVDLYLACRTGASNIANILYANQGDGTFVAVPNAGGAAGPVGVAVQGGAGPGTADTVVAADYDLDGFLDLFVTNGLNLRPLGFGGSNKLFHNSGNANHWVEIDLVGKASNSDREAVGARVYATANQVTQLRVQNGGYHRWAQDSRRVHFGLAGATAVTTLKVEWPSGGVQTFSNVAANKLYRITEGAGIAALAR